MKIIFAGTPLFASYILEELLKQHEVFAVYTQPDKPAGRGQKLTQSPVKQLALSKNIPVFQPKSLKAEEAVSEFAALKPDLMIVAAYGLILPKNILDIPRLGCLNVHASLLPLYRGAAPIQAAILNGDLETGVTIMQMDVGLDTGDMLFKQTVKIDEQDTLESLHNKLAVAGAKALQTVLEDLPSYQEKRQKQNNDLANYAGKIEKDQALIDWQKPALILARQVRAFYPWPISFSYLDKQIVRIGAAQFIKTDHTSLPGSILKADKQGILVAAGQDALLIQKLQLPGSKMLEAAQVLNAKAKLFAPGQQFSQGLA